MKRVLGIVSGFLSTAPEEERVMVLEEKEAALLPRREVEVDLFLSSMLRERDRRVGNGSAKGEGVFDFRYGPFTGGLGESGIVHMATYGEKILGVEIDLHAKHRGIEAALSGTSPLDAARRAQMVCTNFGFSHSHAFSLAVEGIGSIELSEYERRLTVIALELERAYNHLHVMAGLAGAAAQRVLATHLAALFERSLRVNALFAGSRYLLNLRVPGAMALRHEIDGGALRREISALRERFERLLETSLTNRNYLDRLHDVAVVKRDTAVARSLTGPSLRATGIEEDLRTYDDLYDGYRAKVRLEGDSLARMEVRAEEILSSWSIVDGQLTALEREVRPTSARVRRAFGSNRDRDLQLPDHGTGCAAVEGPSGVIAWAVELRDRRVEMAHASTPSLFGYQVFAEALTGHIFTDFPFALDSFGLSFADAAR